MLWLYYKTVVQEVSFSNMPPNKNELNMGKFSMKTRSEKTNGWIKSVVKDNSSKMAADTVNVR